MQTKWCIQTPGAWDHQRPCSTISLQTSLCLFPKLRGLLSSMWHVVILIHTRDELVSSRLKPSPGHMLRAWVTGHHSSSPATQSQTGVWNGCRCYQFCQSWQPLQHFNAAQMVCWCMSPFVTEIEEWQGLCPCEATEFQLVTNYTMF